MSRWQGWPTCLVPLALAACILGPTSPPPTPTATDDNPTKGFPIGAGVRDSVWLPVDRAGRPPAGYGLYTVLLARSADRVTVKVLAQLFTTTGSAARVGDPARQPQPHHDSREEGDGRVTRARGAARGQSDAMATDLMAKQYDFGEAALLMASVCQSAQTKKVLKACGSALPDGPLLVTGLVPLDGKSAPSQRLLVVNLGATPPDAVREVIAAYRRQILRVDYTGPGELDGWRLWVLDHVLDAANLLPMIRKAYTTTA